MSVRLSRIMLRVLLPALLALALVCGPALALRWCRPTTGVGGKALMVDGPPPVVGARADDKGKPVWSRGPYLKKSAKHVRNPHQENRGDCKR